MHNDDTLLDPIMLEDDGEVGDDPEMDEEIGDDDEETEEDEEEV